jgi:hypothetical protein
MLRKAILSFSACALLGSALALPAVAAPITVLFAGTIVSVTDPQHYLDPSIVVGSPFTGSYTVDPAFSLSSALFGGVRYTLTSPASIQASIQGVPFTNDVAIQVLVADGYTGAGGGDLWTFVSNASALPIGALIVVPFFQDTSGAKLDSDAFFVNQALAGWDVPQLFVTRWNGVAGENLALGTITSVTIPEPATSALLAGALAAMASIRSARRRRGRGDVR